MPSVFISYASQQLAAAQQLEKTLKAQEIIVWRDKTQLHAGERWPKKLGDAIADADAVVLLWSSEASQSPFVELEWNIAVAMQKPVMPCLLDQAQLPPTLKPLHRLPGDDLHRTADHLVAALENVPAPANPQPQKTLLAKLETMHAGAEQSVLQELKTFIHQPNWTVQNVYQVQGDVHVNQKEDIKPHKSPVERIGAWVALVVGVLTIAGWFMDLHTKMGWITPPVPKPAVEKNHAYPFEGQIRDAQGLGLADVDIVLLVPGQEPIRDKTRQEGVFSFTVKTKANTDATFQAHKDGFAPVTRNVTIPDQRFIVRMQSQQEKG